MSEACGASVSVAHDADGNGLAQMLSGLIGQNLSDHPARQATLARMHGRVAVIAEDAGVAVTLWFADGKLRVEDGIVGLPDLTVRASTDDVVQMSLLELGRWGLPKLQSPGFRSLLGAVRRGRVQIFGGLTAVPLMLRLTRLVSVA